MPRRNSGSDQYYPAGAQPTPRHGAGLRSVLYRGLTGGTQGRPDSDSVRERLLMVAGPSDRTRSGIDLTRAAAVLGVSRRTLERWVAQERDGTGQRPSPGNDRQLSTAARKAASTQAGRRAVVARLPRPDPTKQVRLKVSGLQGTARGGRYYLRRRDTTVFLSAGSYDRMLAAYASGGDKGLQAWLTGYYSGGDQDNPVGYGGGAWHFGDITGLGIDFPDQP